MISVPLSLILDYEIPSASASLNAIESAFQIKSSKACSSTITGERAIASGQTFCDVPTCLHLFYGISHAIRKSRCHFLLVYSVILGILRVTLYFKHM